MSPYQDGSDHVQIVSPRGMNARVRKAEGKLNQPKNKGRNVKGIIKESFKKKPRFYPGLKIFASPISSAGTLSKEGEGAKWQNEDLEVAGNSNYLSQ